MVKANSITFVECVEQICAAENVNAQTRMIPNALPIVASASSARIEVLRSPYAAGPANATDRSGETTPGIRKAQTHESEGVQKE